MRGEKQTCRDIRNNVRGNGRLLVPTQPSDEKTRQKKTPPPEQSIYQKREVRIIVAY